MPTLQRNGQPNLYYDLDDYTDPWREAPYLLLQHGFGRSSKFWYRWIPYLSRFYKIVRPDLRGFGASGKNFDTERDMTFNTLCDDLEAIVDHLGVDNLHYCGESFGGILGTQFAAERPNRVRTLSLISTRVYLNQTSKERYQFGKESWESALKQLGPKGWAEAKNASDRFPPDTDPGLKQWFAEEQGKSDVASLVAAQKLALAVDNTPYLARLQSPVLCIYPSQGPITTPEQEELLRKHVRNLKLVHLPSQHHSLHITQAAACCNHVLYFIAQHDGIACRE